MKVTTHIFPSKLFYLIKKALLHFLFFQLKNIKKVPTVRIFGSVRMIESLEYILLKQDNAFFLHRSLANVLTITHFLSFIIKNMACHKSPKIIFITWKKIWSRVLPVYEVSFRHCMPRFLFSNLRPGIFAYI